MKVYFWVLYSVALICISVFVPTHHTVLITVGLQYCLKSERVKPPALFFLFRIALAILGLLRFHINFRLICSSFVKTVMGNSMGLTLNLHTALDSLAILMTFILPI